MLKLLLLTMYLSALGCYHRFYKTRSGLHDVTLRFLKLTVVALAITMLTVLLLSPPGLSKNQQTWIIGGPEAGRMTTYLSIKVATMLITTLPKTNRQPRHGKLHFG